MGMSATQARYLNLIAQQSDLEFQGQQINESRTTLSEQTNNLYTQLQNMDVPTPPMTGDYTNLIYTTTDGAVNYTLGTIRPSAKKAGSYNMDLSFTNVGDNLNKLNTSSLVSYSEAKVKVSPVEIGKEEYETGKYTTTPAGKDADYYVGGDTITGDKTSVITESNKHQYLVDEGNGNYSAVTSVPVDSSKTYIRKYTKDEWSEKPAEFQASCTGITAETDMRDKVLELAAEEISNYYIKTPEPESEYFQLSVSDSRVKAVDGKNGYYTITPAAGETLLKKDEAGGEIDNPNPGKLLVGGREALTWAQVMADYGSLIPEHLEESYLDAVKHAFPDDPDIDLNDFYFTVSTKGGNVDLTFYKQEEITQTGVTGATASGYSYASSQYTETRNYDYIDIQFDQTGRISKISIPTAYDENGVATAWKALDVSAKTVTDEKAYADAMAKYEHKKFLYDQDQTAINAQMSIIQQEDKKLELKLTRLDNERTQITTEIEALEKVINDNIEASYKTFSG